MSRSGSALQRENLRSNNFRYKAVELSEAIERLEKILSKKPFEIIQQNLIDQIDETDDVYYGQMVDLFLMMIVKKKKVIELLNDETVKRAKSVPKPVTTPRPLADKPLKLSSKNQVASQRDLPNPNAQGNFYSNRQLSRADIQHEDIEVKGIEPKSPMPPKPPLDLKDQNCRKVLFEDRTSPKEQHSVADSVHEETVEKYKPKVTSRGIVKDQKIKSFFKEFENRKKSRCSPLENSRLGNLISAQISMKEERGYLTQPRENLQNRNLVLQTSRENLAPRHTKQHGAPMHSRVGSIVDLPDSRSPSRPPISLNQTLQPVAPPLHRDTKLEMNRRPTISIAANHSHWQSLKENSFSKRDKAFRLPQSESLVNSINRIKAAHEKFDKQDSAIQNRSKDRIEQFKNRLVMVQKE
jgi:hypothetical protein